MGKELLIMRHAHAADLENAHDLTRPLKKKGKRFAQRMGVWLAQNEAIPDIIISSPAVRAETTAHKTCKSAGLSTSIITIDKDLYNATAQDILELLRVIPPEVNRLLLVGHNPGLEIVLAELCTTAIPKTKKGNYLPPGTLARLELDRDWVDIRANCATLKEMVYPKKLPEGFPYPMPNGKERRIRPAYYYTQACAIPYRQGVNGPEILLVSSSARKHWIIPKGVVDPGLSLQEAAAQEALEEGGILGEVAPQKIGQYKTEKWDARCVVTVFPMKVTEELHPEIWEETHRLRRWVSLPTAVELIESRDLADIVAHLPAYLEGDMEWE